MNSPSRNVEASADPKAAEHGSARRFRLGKAARSETRQKEDDIWHQMHGDEALRLLEVDPRTGLTTAEALRRQAKFGFNTITQRPPPPAWLRFVRQFNQPLVYLLLAAVVV